LEGIGVDTENVKIIPGEFTATFFANTDLANAQIASFYPGAMAYAAGLSLYELAGGKPDFVVISPNEPEAMDRYAVECQQLDIPYLYDPSQQIPRLSEAELRRGVEGALALFVNNYEFWMIRNRTGMTAEDLLQCVQYAVVTDGEKGSTIYTRHQEYHVPAVAPERIVDPTGVGDAFRGGFLKGLSRAWDLETCGQSGSLAATYCLEQVGPQGHHFTRAEFVARFRRYFDDRGQLDELVEG
jgi:adenosine kinase